MAARKQRDSVAPRRRRRRSRARKPKWLEEMKDLDAIAQRRCLMILSVLSGEKTVEEAAREADIQPALYYHFEKKALTAMLAALVPGATKDGSPAPVVAQMEKRISELETTKRRLERLLFLTRMTVSPGPVTTGKRGRPRTRALEERGMTTTRPTAKKKRSPNTTSKTSEASTPMPAGADAP